MNIGKIKKLGELIHKFFFFVIFIYINNLNKIFCRSQLCANFFVQIIFPTLVNPDQNQIRSGQIRSDPIKL